MFAIDETEKLHIFTTERELIPQPGWTVIAMISTEKDESTLRAVTPTDRNVCPDAT